MAGSSEPVFSYMKQSVSYRLSKSLQKSYHRKKSPKKGFWTLPESPCKTYFCINTIF